MARLVLDESERALAVLGGVAERDMLGPDDVTVCEACGVVIADAVDFQCIANPEPSRCTLRKHPGRANVGMFVAAGLRALHEGDKAWRGFESWKMVVGARRQ